VVLLWYHGGMMWYCCGTAVVSLWYCCGTTGTTVARLWCHYDKTVVLLLCITG